MTNTTNSVYCSCDATLLYCVVRNTDFVKSSGDPGFALMFLGGLLHLFAVFALYSRWGARPSWIPHTAVVRTSSGLLWICGCVGRLLSPFSLLPSPAITHVLCKSVISGPAGGARALRALPSALASFACAGCCVFAAACVAAGAACFFFAWLAVCRCVLWAPIRALPAACPISAVSVFLVRLCRVSLCLRCVTAHARARVLSV